MNTLFLDCETFSEVELKTRGTYVYTEACGVMLLSYAWNDEPVECVDLTAGQPLPDFSKAERVVAHNAMFDRLATKKILDIPIELWFCSMVQALSHGLPGSLDELCEIYRISDDKAKIKDGRRLIQLFCKPRKTKNGLVRNTRETHPEEWARFIEYAKNDIEAMREIHKKLPRWNYPRQPELALWHLDQVINDRGVMIDREMGEAAIRAIKRAQASLSEQTADMTGGGLESTTQVAAMIQFIFEEYGVHFNDLTKAQVSKAIDDPDIPEPVKDLLRVRQQASSSSTAKYKALLNRANADDRFRGGIQFAGASRTRRACIAEGTLVDVKTDTGQYLKKPIEKIDISDMVWDGESWVNHEGVVFSGVKDIIYHDGVSATAEHIVWLDSSTRVAMSEAKQTGVKLWNGNITSTD